MGNWVKTGLPCPCGTSSDAYALDQDGNGYCFSGYCKKPFFFKDQLELNKEVQVRDLNTKAYTTKDEGPKFKDGDLRVIPHRSLSESTLRFYDIRTRFQNNEPEDVGFKYPSFIKVRNLHDKSKIWVEGESRPGLYGKDKFDPGSKESITITVGEWDAPSIYEATRGQTAAVSCRADPHAKRDCTVDRDYINSFNKIILCFDNDESGQKAAKDVSSLFDFNKLYHVRLTKYKDASEYFQNGEADNLEKIWKAAKRYSPDNIISQFSDIRAALKKSQEDQIGTYPFKSLQSMTYGLHRGEIVVFKGFEKIGKQLSLDTKIPTPIGWTTMRDLNKGDVILGADGKETRVSFITDVQYNVDCYNVEFSDGTFVIAGGPHRWKVIDERNREFIKTTKEILDEGVISRDSVARYSVPLSKPLEFSEKTLPIDPYLLGYWLGDGHSYSAGLSVGKQDIEDTSIQLRKRGHTLQHKEQRTCYTIKSPNLTHKQLSDQKLLKNKHIPSIYLRGSFDQRLELLKGLMDSDGSVSKNRTGHEFYSSNKELAYETLELIRSLGLPARISEKQSKLYGINKKLTYRIRFLRNDFEVFSLFRKRQLSDKAQSSRLLKKSIRKITPVKSVPSKCIQVDNPDHLYLCGDGWTVTHNTEIFRAIEHHLLKTTNKNIGIIHLEEDNGTTIKGIAGYELQQPAIRPDCGLSEDDIYNAYVSAVSNSDTRVHLYQSFETEDEDLFLDSIRFLAAGAGCEFIFFDHISWLATGKSDSDDERKKLDRISQKLKLLAKELGICILMISHVNDEGKTRGSRNITKVANTIIHMDRDKLSIDETTRRTTHLTLEGVRLGGLTGPAGALYMDAMTDCLRDLEYNDNFPEAQESFSFTARKAG